MPTITLGDIFQFTLRHTGGSQQFANVLYAGALGTNADPAQSQQLCQDFADAFKDAWRQGQTNDVSWTNWTARQVRGAGVSYDGSGNQVGGVVFEGDFSGTLTGSDAANEPMAYNSALVASVKTGFAGRRKRGRIYLAGMAEVVQNGGIFESAAFATLTGYIDAWFAAYKNGGSDSDWRYGIWSTRTATGKAMRQTAANGPYTLTLVDTPAPNDAWVEASSISYSNIVHTQRRRTIGVGA